MIDRNYRAPGIWDASQQRQQCPVHWPAYGADEIEAACRVLRSGKVNYWTGEEGRLFEREFATATESKFAVAVANGTLALELALYALGVGPGDEVVVPSRTFVATASCVLMRHAIPVFADVNEESQTLTAETIEQVLTPRTKGIIAVHLAGWPCDMEGILAVARAHGLLVIEDCAQAQGARYKGRPVGSFGDAAAFSFCQDKIMSTGGEGGMLVTNREDVWRRAWSFKDHGKDTLALKERTGGSEFRWLHHSAGTNWRMTEIQSALGRTLLPKVPGFIEKRRGNAHLLTHLLRDLPELRIPVPPDTLFHSYYKYYVFLNPNALRKGCDRDTVLSAVRAEGIPCFSGTCSEVYLEKAFHKCPTPKQRLPVARLLGETSMMFLVHPTLGQNDMLATFNAIKKVLARADPLNIKQFETIHAT